MPVHVSGGQARGIELRLHFLIDFFQQLSKAHGIIMHVLQMRRAKKC